MRQLGLFRPRGTCNWRRAGAGLELYHQSRACGAEPSIRCILDALKECSRMQDVENGGRIHRFVVESGKKMNVFVASALVDMYAKCSRLAEAREVFETLARPNVVCWNCLIGGYAQNGEGLIALQLYARMGSEGNCVANHVTLLAVLKACSCLAERSDAESKLWLQTGKAIHARAVQLGEEGNILVASTLVDMYTKCASMEDARRVFQQMPERNVVAWTSIIQGYVRNGEPDVALELYSAMQDEGSAPDGITVVAGLQACACLAEYSGLQREVILVKAKDIQRQALRAGIDMTNIVLVSTLMDTYAKCGCMGEARQMFDGMLPRDEICWNNLILSYVKCGDLLEAQHVFDKMPARGIEPWNSLMLGYAQNGQGQLTLQLYKDVPNSKSNVGTFVAVLEACSELADLEAGKQVHVEIQKQQMQGDAHIATSLVHFYGKCGCMGDAEKVFAESLTKDLAMWGALISGYSRQCATSRVFDLFSCMQAQRLKPDTGIFLSILTTCSHAGMVNEGQGILQSMWSKYGVTPLLEHYNCMLDAFARANRFQDAGALLEEMPFEPNEVTWTALMGGAYKWSNLEVGQLAFSKLVKINPTSTAAYVMMANICAGLGMYDKASEIQLMRRYKCHGVASTRPVQLH